MHLLDFTCCRYRWKSQAWIAHIDYAAAKIRIISEKYECDTIKMSFGCFLFLSEIQETSLCLICNQQLIPAAVCMMAAGIFVLTEAVNLIKHESGTCPLALYIQGTPKDMSKFSDAK